MRLINVRGMYIPDNREFAKIDYDYYISNVVVYATVMGSKNKKEDETTYASFRFMVEFENRLRMYSAEFLSEFEAGDALKEYLIRIGYEL